MSKYYFKNIFPMVFLIVLIVGTNCWCGLFGDSQNEKLFYFTINLIVIVMCVKITIKYVLLMHGEKYYALGIVIEAERKSGKSGPYLDVKYEYRIDGDRFTDSEMFEYENEGDETKYLNKQFIVTLLKKKHEVSAITIHTSVNQYKLQQPRAGWRECPINENGTVKEEFKN